MVSIVLTICIALVLFGRSFYRTIINPVSLYNASWVVCTTCSSIICEKYGGYPINVSIYWLVILTCLVFSVVCVVVSNRKIREKRIQHRQMACEPVDGIQYNRLYILNIIAIFSLMPDLIKSLRILVTKGMYYARLEQLVGEGTEFIIASLYRQMIVLPVISATIFISIVALVYNTSSNKKRLFFIALIGLIVYSLTVMGRWLLLKTGIFLLLTFILRTRKNGLNLSKKVRVFLKRMKKWIILLGIILVASLFLITSQRTYAGDVWYTIVAYFGGSLKYLDMGIQDMTANGEILFGSGLFASVWDMPLIVFQKLLDVDFLRPLEITYLYNNPVKMIGPALPFTGFGTVLMSMYLDGGTIGIIVDSVILAFLATFVYRMMDRGNNDRNIVIGLYTLLLLSVVTIQWDGTSLSSMMTYVYIVLFYKGKYKVRLFRR